MDQVDMRKEHHTNPKSKQFSDPRLASVYDSINSLGDDRDFWLREIERISPSTIIDFGCGTGLLTCELAKRGYQMIGIDPAIPMLEIARRKPHADNVQWIEGDYQKLPELQADLVLMTSHVAQFLLDDDEWNGMLSMAHNALTNNGHILFDSRRSLVESFKGWPTEQSPRRIKDPLHGEIEYWSNLLETNDRVAQYELHYLFKESAEVIVSTDEILFRTYDEIQKSLIAAGFTVQAVYGDWDGSVFDEKSPEMIFLARRR